MAIKIFLIGATGYIGGSTLARLLKHPNRESFEITLLLRSPAKAKSFEAFGLKTVIGSFSDVDMLERVSSESDVVFQSADADGLALTAAILKGLKTRFQTTKTPPALIFTSGTGLLVDECDGTFEGKTVYSDLNVEQLESLPDTAFHREVELAVIAADKEGYAKTFIVLPCTIWGIASNGFTEKGLQNPISQQIPGLIKTSLARRKTVILGTGENIWNHVEIGETADFYYTLFDAIISGKNPSSGREGYYFVENGEYHQKQTSEAAATALYKLGKVDSDRPVPVTAEEIKAFPVIAYLGTNSRARGERSRALGWKPVKGIKDFVESIKIEVDYLLRQSA